jgi:threonine synthase
MEQILPIMRSCAVTQQSTSAQIRAYHESHSYLLDPHSAVAAAGLNEVKLRTNEAKQSENEKNESEWNQVGDTYCCLCTATPAKFPQTVLAAIGVDDDAQGTNRARLFDRYQDLRERQQYDVLWPRDAMGQWEETLRGKVREISARK